MAARIRTHIRTNVVGYIALFCFAMSGTATAINGPLAGKNTVGSSDIINGEVKSADVGSDSLDGTDIKDNSITGDDVSDSTFVGQAASTMPVPAQGTSAAAFDVTTVQGNGLERKLVEITGMCSVSLTAAADGSFDIEIENLSSTETLSFSNSAPPSIGQTNLGGIIAPSGAGHIATSNTAQFMLRSIQISAQTGDDAPMATLTLSTRQLAGGDQHVATQLLASNP